MNGLMITMNKKTVLGGGITTLLILAVLSLSLLSSGCKSDDDPGDYDVPTTYNFENVDYSGQTTRQDMLDAMVTYMETANQMGVSLDAQRLKDMYANQNDAFNDPALDGASKQLKDKTFSLVRDQVEAWLDSVALASQSTVAGSNGVAGVVSNGTSSRLFSATGVEYTEMVEKGLMGACFYYQITDVYLGEDKIGDAVDNTTITPGKGTDMEHHWDEAFGYFGVPIDFPSNTTGLRYIGKYTHAREAVLGLNSLIMDAYLKGRAAISNKDMATKQTQVTVLRHNLEQVFAGTLIYYLNSAKANLADDVQRNHVLSEARGFIWALQFNPEASITVTQVNDLLATLGDNFYEVTVQDIDSVRDEVATIFGLESVKDQL